MRAERGAKARQALQGCAGLGEFVEGKPDWIAFALRNRDGSNFAREKSSGQGVGGTLLAAHSEGVLVFARNFVLVSQVFCSFAHGFGAIKSRHFGIDKAPSEAAVKHLAVVAKGR